MKILFLKQAILICYTKKTLFGPILESNVKFMNICEKEQFDSMRGNCLKYWKDLKNLCENTEAEVLSYLPKVVLTFPAQDN